MLRVDNQLGDHCLYDPYVAIERATQQSAKQSDPEIEGEAYNEQRSNRAEASHQEHRLPS